MPEEDTDTCLYCAHCRVCAIFIGVQPLLTKWEKDPPIEAINLYKICSAKLPVMVKGETNGLVSEVLTK